MYYKIDYLKKILSYLIILLLSINFFSSFLYFFCSNNLKQKSAALWKSPHVFSIKLFLLYLYYTFCITNHVVGLVLFLLCYPISPPGVKQDLQFRIVQNIKVFLSIIAVKSSLDPCPLHGLADTGTGKEQRLYIKFRGRTQVF